MLQLGKNQDLVRFAVIVGGVLLLLYLMKTYYFDNEAPEFEGADEGAEGAEGYVDYESFAPNSGNEEAEPTLEVQEASQQQVGPSPAESAEVSSPRSVESASEVSNLGGAMLPNQCFPKDVLNAQDLLPKDASTTWGQTNPQGQGALGDQNFLTAGYHTGINTVGTTLRNPSHDLRSEHPNPQVKVSPWQQTTISPDVFRKPFEIGGTA